MLASADDIGQVALFEIDPVSGRRTRIVGRGQVAEFAPARNSIVIAWASLGGPADLFVATRDDREPQRLTNVNRRILSERSLGDYEQFSFAGADGATVYGYVVKPYGYTPGKKFPIAFLVHGGPQVSFQNQWSWRWNAQTFAGAGYGVVFIDITDCP